MSKNANKRPDNPNIEKDDVTQGRKPNEVEERPADRVRGQEEGNKGKKEGPPVPTPDPAGGNL